MTQESANTPQPPEFEAELLEDARKLFAGPCTFVKGVADLSQLPDIDRMEVAFAGRSNVGKSSLLNALTNRTSLARTSNTPGRTRELNYFALGELLYIVDMPGYGYAKVEKRLVEAWNKMIRNFLLGRVELRRVFLLIDSRHGPKPNDIEVMTSLDAVAMSYQIVLTKIDKIKLAELSKVLEHTAKVISKHPAAHPDIHLTSSAKGTGINALQAEILTLARL